MVVWNAVAVAVVVVAVGVLLSSCDEALLRSEYKDPGAFTLLMPDPHFLQHAQDSIALVARQAIIASQQAASASVSAGGGGSGSGMAAAGVGYSHAAHHHQHHHHQQNQLQHQQQRQRTEQATNERKCCVRAVAALRSMARLTHALRAQHCLQLFRDIEMPLMISVSDLEFSGFPVNLEFFKQLGQDLRDRHHVVETLLARVTGAGAGPVTRRMQTLGGYAARQPPQVEIDDNLINTVLRERLGQQRRDTICDEWNKLTHDNPEMARRLSALILGSTGTVAGCGSVDMARCLVLSQPTRQAMHTGQTLSQYPPPLSQYPPPSQHPHLSHH